MNKPEWSWNLSLFGGVVFAFIVELLDRRPEASHFIGFFASLGGWLIGCLIGYFALFFIWKARQR